jgi:DNA-binding NtrC family response regulator
MDYAWPGNVRELENSIERACVLCEGNIIRFTDLPGGFPTPATSTGEETDAIYPLNHPVAVNLQAPAPETGPSGQPLLRDFLRDQELAFLNRTLASTGGDKERAAQMLGISLATLYRKLAEDTAH